MNLSSQTDGLFAYTDESGNSGLNLFDKGQPYFWTGTVISFNDLQVEAEGLIKHCAEKLQVKELHANELGLSKIELIADDFISFIKTHNLKFIFTRTSKQHFASVKFTDIILDSEYNKAVLPLHYSNKNFRLMFTYHLTLALSLAEAKKFWKVYKTGNKTQLIEILTIVQQRLERTCPDVRLKALLSDAIQFAKQYPERFVNVKRSDMDSPNITAFFSILNVINGIYHQTGLQIKNFVHDDQNQFAKYFQKYYKNMKDLIINNSTYPWNTSFEMVNVLATEEVQIRNSETSYGLQIVDIALWLMKKYLDHPERQIRGKCNNLINAIILNGQLTQFTEQQLEENLMDMTKEIRNIPFTQIELDNGKSIVSKSEEIRLERKNIFSIE
ncbi:MULTISPECIES: DUF3800 domain-containing protein [Bacillus]|uniref:Uncharacterized protein DUF3800 n=1 Tax=Bacillus mycoides TaxID=1405 RepID=A0A3D9UXK4_BACMY|nr:MULTISPECIES: DUF3800 domain-containing protein [Bacillus]RBP20665.1 uncharacterized protein DUF3800 [Bacillus sp. DB-2]REF33936.1 uncharacterized protein DUF3800 [Bacillus mycoides]